ncbi:MAG: TIGR00730 family Rossman fold protein [Alphaproteobacteria bacterium]|nr:TIGR00730 family Rossman fold protein [Alphaproteobacteria bacterium]
MSIIQSAIGSVGVFCGSSNAAPRAWLDAAAALGRILAREKVRLVYGGGGVGLMGACARAAFESGGSVLGVIPDFLTGRENPVAGIETEVVATMHARKQRMFEESDGFAVLPGAIGTLEEAIEILSWRRLGLHAKPIVFLSPDGFWAPLFDQFERFIAHSLSPTELRACVAQVDRPEDILPALRAARVDIAVDLHMAART